MLRRRFLLDGPDRLGTPGEMVRATGRSRATVHRWISPDDSECVDPDITDLQRLVQVYPVLRNEVREIVAGPDDEAEEVRDEVARLAASVAKLQQRLGKAEG